MQRHSGDPLSMCVPAKDFAFRRQLFSLLCALLCFGLVACSEGPTPPGEGSAADDEQSVPFKRMAGDTRRIPESARLAPELLDGVCGLNRRTLESKLTALFGQGSQRQGSAQVGLVLLTWKRESFLAWARFDRNGALEDAGAGSRLKGIRGDTRLEKPDFSALATGSPSIREVEAVLGPGVLTGAQWKRGISVAASLADKMPKDIGKDRCVVKYTWLVAGMENPLNVEFSRKGVVTNNIFVKLAR